MPKYIQVCFVVDCGKSMTGIMNNFRDKLISSIQMFLDRNYDVNMELAFVGFKDIADYRWLDKIPFTFDIQSFERSLLNVKTTGATGKFRNVTEALSIAQYMNWMASRQLIVLITSAPTHGLKYHEMSKKDDDFPNGHIWLYLESEVFDIAKKGIDILVVELNKSTRKMIDVMKTEYHICRNTGFNVIDYGQMIEGIMGSIQRLIES
jgi:hypothetical protein